MDVQDENVQSKAMNIKVVVMGESSVGKTCIISVINTGKCLVNTSSTVGAGFIVKKFDFDGKQIKLSIWDTAGQEKYRSLVNEIKAEFEEMPCLYLLGNKIDLESQRTVPWEKGSEYAKKIGATFMEVSALTQPLEIHQFIKGVASGIVNESRSFKNEDKKIVQQEKRSCC